MEVVGSDRKEFLWEVVDGHVIEEENDHEDTGLREFDFSFFDKDEKGVIIEGLSEYSYLLILMKQWTGY